MRRRGVRPPTPRRAAAGGLRRRDAPGNVAPHGPHTPPRRQNQNVAGAAVAAALLVPALLLTAGCGGEATVVTAEPAPAYQPVPARPAPAPRRERRPDPAPPAPVAVRDAPEEPEADPAPAVEPEPEVVRDDAYFAKLWAELPPAVAPLPPPLEPLPEQDVRRLRAELLAYLREAAGRHRLPKERPDEGVPVDFWPLVEAYWEFEEEYAKHKPELHALMERDLWLVEKLLERNEGGDRASALGLVRWAIICAAQYIKDGRLAVAVAEVYLVPHLASADAATGDITPFVGRESLLRSAVTAFEAGKNWERMARACGDIVRLNPRNRNQSDAWRAKLAVALEHQGRRDEAVTVLEDIHDPSMTALRNHYLNLAADAEAGVDAPAPGDGEK